MTGRAGNRRQQLVQLPGASASPLCLIPVYVHAAPKNPDSVFIEVICYGFYEEDQCQMCPVVGGQCARTSGALEIWLGSVCLSAAS